MRRPNSMRHLDDAIRGLCGCAPQDFVRARTVMANAIVASMLPDGVVKGGSALKMRFGEENTRFTDRCLEHRSASGHRAFARLMSRSDFATSKTNEKMPAYGCLATMNTATQATDSETPMASRALRQFDLS